MLKVFAKKIKTRKVAENVLVKIDIPVTIVASFKFYF